MAPLRRGRRGGARMTWLGDLGAELDRAGIHGATRRRIELELADHLACDPSSEARLGSPREVAERFAAELRTTRTRRAAWRSFFALALTAGLLMVHARALSPVGNWSAVAGTNATFVSLGGLMLVLCAQIAFVAGVLALEATARRDRRGFARPAARGGRAARRSGGRGRRARSGDGARSVISRAGGSPVALGRCRRLAGRARRLCALASLCAGRDALRRRRCPGWRTTFRRR